MKFTCRAWVGQKFREQVIEKLEFIFFAIVAHVVYFLRPHGHFQQMRVEIRIFGLEVHGLEIAKKLEKTLLPQHFKNYKLSIKSKRKIIIFENLSDPRSFRDGILPRYPRFQGWWFNQRRSRLIQYRYLIDLSYGGVYDLHGGWGCVVLLVFGNAHRQTRLIKGL